MDFSKASVGRFAEFPESVVEVSVLDVVTDGVLVVETDGVVVAGTETCAVVSTVPVRAGVVAPGRFMSAPATTTTIPSRTPVTAIRAHVGKRVERACLPLGLFAGISRLPCSSGLPGLRLWQRHRW
jgi:hypothetical protein